jgi:transcriptional regulator CtsR
MGVSDRIEAFILELMKQQENKDRIKLQRNELAQLFGCVPSQINYVMSTRFSPDRGYVVESRRGGGGYLTIRKLPSRGAVVRVGDTATEKDAEKLTEQLTDMELISSETAAVMKAALSEKALAAADNADKVRADILKSMLDVMS